MEVQNQEAVQQKKSFFSSGLFRTVIILILIIVIVGILSFLDIIPFKKLFSFKSNNNTAVQTETKTPGKPTPVGFACPTATPVCKKPKYTTFNGHSAVIFTIGKNYSAYAIGNFLGMASDTATVGKDKAQLNRYTFIYKNACYTATYVFPHGMLISNLSVFPYPKGAAITRAQDDEVLSLNNQSFNVLLQLQKRAVDPDSKKPDTQRCSLLDPKESASGTYIDLSTVVFD